MSSEIESNFYIIYPKGDRDILSVVEIPWSIDYEIADYDRASSKTYATFDEAEGRAKELAEEFGKTYRSDNDRPAFLE